MGVVPGPELLAAADRLFEQDAVGVLEDYVGIPCLSPGFDAEWEANGHIEAAARLLADWAGARPLPGLTVELSHLPGLTPVINAEVPATPGYRSAGPVLLYGHLDKQPPLGAWREGLDPFVAVREGDLLYGRVQPTTDTQCSPLSEHCRRCTSTGSTTLVAS
jgi:acetylornithine deacetylase/succinyl-diaminopimelate desuccinylase-like protein